MDKNVNNNSKCESSGNSRKGEIISQIYVFVSAAAVIICIIGMVCSFFGFYNTTKKFSNECTDVLIKISSSASSGTSSEISVESSSEGLSDIFSGKSSSDSSDSSDSRSSRTDEIKSLIAHMESMIAIQKSGMTNDLMSFIYGILSTILVGLCAGFVVKSQDNADKAKETVEMAKENANIAKEQAENAAKEAEKTENAISNAQKATKEAKKNAEMAKKQAEELRYHIRVIVIYNNIFAAKSALAEHNIVLANKAFDQMYNEVTSLFSDKEFTAILKRIDDKEVEIIYEEINSLRQNVDSFLAECRKEYDGTAKLESMECAAKNYKNWINKALRYMLGKNVATYNSEG